ncbi:metalloregulator ArsR/SmtB family transcription factor [Candidatus Wolfebacteria bacterium]|nr:metalloregulator ArsR/SmtB family transcription factor [Candidatus Wolfebacteria bacterium]
MQQWELVFRTLGNINRLKIIKILSKETVLAVSEIAEKLDISVKATSQHLIILKNVGVLESVGKAGYVFYSLKPKPPKEFAKAIKLFL